MEVVREAEVADLVVEDLEDLFAEEPSAVAEGVRYPLQTAVYHDM